MTDVRAHVNMLIYSRLQNVYPLSVHSDVFSFYLEYVWGFLCDVQKKKKFKMIKRSKDCNAIIPNSISIQAIGANGFHKYEENVISSYYGDWISKTVFAGTEST